MAAPFRAVFFGTPEIAVPALEALYEVAHVCGVVCQPDRPAGRGMKLRAPAVKIAAQARGLEVYQPTRVRTGELEQWVRERAPEVALVMAYGRILPPGVLTAPRLGCLNLHASVLPKYRGAAPIQWAIFQGDGETGISLMQMDEGLDTGPVLAIRSLPIGPEETAGELAERLAELAATVTRLDLPRAVDGELDPVPQPSDLASHAPPITRADTLLNWSESAERLSRRVRGLAPRPGASALLRRRKGGTPTHLRVLGAQSAFEHENAPPGRVLVRGPSIYVGTGQGLLRVTTAQLEGRRALSAADLVNGRALEDGDHLETPTLPTPSS